MYSFEWPTGGDISGYRKQSSCLEVYDEMTSLCIGFNSAVPILVMGLYLIASVIQHNVGPFRVKYTDIWVW